jgi:hypothetical protein
MATLSHSPSLAPARHPPMVIVHAAVATTTSDYLTTRPGRSRPSDTLATARHHLGDARSDSLDPPCERYRRRRVPSIWQTPRWRPNHRAVSLALSLQTTRACVQGVAPSISHVAPLPSSPNTLPPHALLLATDAVHRAPRGEI